MKAFAIIALELLVALEFTAPAQIPVLKRSDVVFMYQAGRQIYEDYGATVLAWGGKPTAKSREEAKDLKFFGSVGMVTEFSRYYERFPQTYEQGLCRDVEGKPYKVPWLTDHQHKGVPYWWCCTRQPLFREYLSERVVETVKAGADGVHIDDHLGTAGGISQGGCFCDKCVEEFRSFLKALPSEDRGKLGVGDPGAFNFRDAVRAWLAEKPGRKAPQHPLWSQWRLYQFRGAAAFMADLRALAAKTAGRPVPMGANACLLWGPHLSDYQSLDLFSAEIPHHAEARRFNDDPLVAYRLADAVGRPLASTASGHDWAFIKEQNLPGLVEGWIALGYAAGHSLMAPNRQWCYTPQKGTHWYEGPKEKFTPLYQFVRQNAALFDDYQNHADLTVAFSQRTFDRDPAKVIGLCNRLSAANISYRLALGGSEIVDHPLPKEDVRQARRLLVIEPKDFSSADQQVLATARPEQPFENVEQALAGVSPAVRVEAQGVVRVLPRVKSGAAVIHLVNWNYDATRDGVQPIQPLRLRMDLQALGIAGATEASLFAPAAAARKLPMEQGTLTVPELGLWAVVEVRGKASLSQITPAAVETVSTARTNLLNHARRILFLGDSITHGGEYVEYFETFLVMRFPGKHWDILNLGLPSETVSGLSEPGHAGGAFPRPDLHERLDRILVKTKPDLVLACYGMNDGIYYPFSEDRFQKFQDGIRWLRDKVIGAGADIIHLTPPVFDPVPIKDRTLPAGAVEYRQPFAGYNEVLDRYSDWLLAQRVKGWTVLDIHGPMNRYLAERRREEAGFSLARDGVHPGATGHWLMARPLLLYCGAPAEFSSMTDAGAMLAMHPRGKELMGLVQQRQRVLKDAWLTDTGHQRPGMSKGLPLAEAEAKASELEVRIQAAAALFPGRRSAWHGFDRYDFESQKRTVTVIVPRQPLPGGLWAWKGEFLDAFPGTEIALLNKGVHIVYLNAPDLLGSPAAVAAWNACHAELAGLHGLARKPALIGLSRGGLYCYNWASANPDKVACIYGDAPVCDLKSWPGGKGKGRGSPRDWQLAMRCYGFKSEAEALAAKVSPIDRLEPLARANVPLLHVYGDADDVVPWDENTGVLADRFKKLGGTITLIAKPGVGHHPHGLDDPSVVVEFILANTIAANAPQSRQTP